MDFLGIGTDCGGKQVPDLPSTTLLGGVMVFWSPFFQAVHCSTYLLRVWNLRYTRFFYRSSERVDMYSSYLSNWITNTFPHPTSSTWTRTLAELAARRFSACLGIRSNWSLCTVQILAWRKAKKKEKRKEKKKDVFEYEVSRYTHTITLL